MDISAEKVEQEIRLKLESAKTQEDLEALRVAYLGKKGAIPAMMQVLKELAPEDRKKFGAEVNRLKTFLETALAEKKEALSHGAEFARGFDETMPGIQPLRGTLHPLKETIREILQIFQRFGFEAVSGPEIETEFYNFSALNIPLDHAARESFDTFYTSTGHLLRSQTSTVQIRVMQNRKPPLRIIAPGRVYRPDTVDASHSFMFHQMEGLMVDEKTTFSDLKGILHLFLRQLFGKNLKLRFRPHFFPFTEPSVEVDIQWGNKGWLEILGAGSVDPNVFEAVGYDPKRYQGFAFGLGIERIAMLRHGITDIRHFFENDLRFLRQF